MRAGDQETAAMARNTRAILARWDFAQKHGSGWLTPQSCANPSREPFPANRDDNREVFQIRRIGSFIRP